MEGSDENQAEADITLLIFCKNGAWIWNVAYAKKGGSHGFQNNASVWSHSSLTSYIYGGVSQLNPAELH